MRSVLLGLGFILSAVTDFVLLWPITLILPIALPIALGTYPMSVVLRGIGWIQLGRERKLRLFVATGFVVLVLGILFYVSLMAAKVLSSNVALWIVYSLMEFSSYINANRRLHNRLIIFACISVIGIALVALVTLPKPTAIEPEALSPLLYAFIFLLSSSVIAATSFLKK